LKGIEEKFYTSRQLVHAADFSLRGKSRTAKVATPR
jgi:hypothetical protein